MLVEEVLTDSPMEFVQIHSINARLNLIVLDLQFLDGLRSGRLFCPVGREHSVTKPIEDRLRYHQFPQDFGKFVGQNFLARVTLWAHPAITGAVVIDVRSLFQLADKQTAAVAAADEPCVCEVVLYLPRPFLESGIQQRLDALPTPTGYERFVSAAVGDTIPIEVTHVQPTPKYLVH